MNSKILGEQGELRAADFLQARGYQIVERNFRIKLGEIDLIALDGDCICFIEVKTRASFDVPQEAVSVRKQRKLTRIAQAYLKIKFGHVDVRSRFDVIAITPGDDARLQVQLIQNAFDVPA